MQHSISEYHDWCYLLLTFVSSVPGTCTSCFDPCRKWWVTDIYLDAAQPSFSVYYTSCTLCCRTIRDYGYIEKHRLLQLPSEQNDISSSKLQRLPLICKISDPVSLQLMYFVYFLVWQFMFKIKQQWNRHLTTLKHNKSDNTYACCSIMMQFLCAQLLHFSVLWMALIFRFISKETPHLVERFLC